MEESIMKLTSSAFEPGGKIPSEYTCDGANICPPLSIRDVPAEAKSLAIIMDDPDVPKGIRPDGIWDHWVVFNIAPHVREIKKGKEPEGTRGRGTGGNLNYYGPCPPDREHRYFIKLYALDAKKIHQSAG
jgi:Raf kinase inhibitor-like YbhB/YbcL family protein